MISDFTDRRPVISGVIITLLFTLVPVTFFIIAGILPGIELNTARILLVYALVIQAVISLKSERMILVMLPFLIMIFSVLLCEEIYIISSGLKAPGGGPGKVAYLFLSVISAVFGPEMIGIVISLIVCTVISAVRELRL